ncbi:glucose-1-phosphate adenylyltransferase subunit GlgD [Ruminiclostridium cellulolyticum]|uniref:Glucose-1-phosphate adenylyltransferase, GlgD subunit n=1 Tax=Ruminiclostridium cellulolyticum (strain ATCC 35319 / DSM 5812 / JCM 6584 / H10) TaxID=394503 RepID=B8I1Q3_RUMCH|nr:glucose-1-phosphate adenylyltransferase subunit GlgD [Ruminiclostridium cellulolyticum]ACL77688.1 glucose-1-phosphate adenylyltransferase, GlgD subunit [Ruminiclostridium cellulolyticum H10]
MKNVMGIIMSGGRNTKLKELSTMRSSPAVPVGGKYRAIDFILSNMVNSGITNIGVIAQYSFRSLMDHLGSGKEWDLDRKTDGLFLFPPFLSDEGTGWYRGTADAMYNNLTFLKRSNEEYVLISQGNCIFTTTFDDMLKAHKEKDADITVAYREMNDIPIEELANMGIMQLDSSSRVIDFQEKPMHPNTLNGSLGIYMIKRELLISLLEESVAHGYYDFVLDIIIKMLHKLKIYGYKYSGYWRSISTVQMYYKCNMELLDPVVNNELLGNLKIYTKVKDEAPAKYNEEAEVKNSIIADGCIIEGTVENSVLFRGVTVKRGAVVKDSIIMQGSVVEENSALNYAILDKSVVLSKSKCLKGEKTWPIIIGKNVVV